MTGPRILLVTPNPASNALGRTYCVWMLAQHLGWPTTTVAATGNSIWEPMRGTAFADSVQFVDPATGTGRRRLDELIEQCDLVLPVKPLPATLGAVYEAARRIGRPLLVDVDDPDIEARTSWRPWKYRLPRRLLSRDYQQLLRMGRLTHRLPVIVSNPALQQMYGGSLVPHVRLDAEPGEYRDTDEVVVRFIGTNRRHKGVEVLRAAVAALADDGYRLELTAAAPDDAKPWERWLGVTTFAQGQDLVATADIIVIPSLDVGWAPAQLPVKLIDAMMLGRPTVATDLPPIRWALGDAGLLVAPGDVQALAAALRALRDRDVRAAHGRAAHARALAMFSVAEVAKTFEASVLGQVARRVQHL